MKTYSDNKPQTFTQTKSVIKVEHKLAPPIIIGFPKYKSFLESLYNKLVERHHNGHTTLVDQKTTPTPTTTEFTEGNNHTTTTEPDATSTPATNTTKVSKDSDWEHNKKNRPLYIIVHDDSYDDEIREETKNSPKNTDLTFPNVTKKGIYQLTVHNIHDTDTKEGDETSTPNNTEHHFNALNSFNGNKLNLKLNFNVFPVAKGNGGHRITDKPLDEARVTGTTHFETPHLNVKQNSNKKTEEKVNYTSEDDKNQQIPLSTTNKPRDLSTPKTETTQKPIEKDTADQIRYNDGDFQEKHDVGTYDGNINHGERPEVKNPSKEDEPKVEDSQKRGNSEEVPKDIEPTKKQVEPEKLSHPYVLLPCMVAVLPYITGGKEIPEGLKQLIGLGEGSVTVDNRKKSTTPQTTNSTEKPYFNGQEYGQQRVTMTPQETTSTKEKEADNLHCPSNKDKGDLPANFNPYWEKVKQFLVFKGGTLPPDYETDTPRRTTKSGKEPITLKFEKPTERWKINVKSSTITTDKPTTMKTSEYINSEVYSEDPIKNCITSKNNISTATQTLEQKTINKDKTNDKVGTKQSGTGEEEIKEILNQEELKQTNPIRPCSGKTKASIVVTTEERSNFIPIYDTRFVHFVNTSGRRSRGN